MSMGEIPLGNVETDRHLYWTVLSVIALGAGLSGLLARFAGWQTAVSVPAVLMAFGFAATVGLVFGIWPALRAARLVPIEALRYE